MNRRFRQPSVIASALICAFATTAVAQEKTAEKPSTQTAEQTQPKVAKATRATEFLRLQRDPQQEPLRLQTAVTRYTRGKGKDKLAVDLVSAVHVGDRSYYQQLNELFEDYDVVLFELVAPKGERPVRGQARNDNPISFLQHSVKSMLNLESQVELVDYRKPNFVHADMTPAQIASAMQQRGDTGMSVALDVMADLIRETNRQEQSLSARQRRELEELDPFELLLNPQSDRLLKRMLAEQFVAHGDMASGLGPTLNRMLITDRNKAAMEVFRKQIADGKRRIAIFYGAAHMPDFQQRLIDEHGLKLKKQKWMTAWDLEKSSRSSQPDPFKLLLELLDEPSS